MKKLLFLFMMMLLPMVARAYDAKIDGIYYNFNNTDKTAQVTYLYDRDSNKSAYSGAVVIPEIVISNGTTYSVSSIGYRAFYYCSGLTAVTLHCQTIGTWFGGYSSIKEIIIGEEVTSIESKAFECTAEPTLLCTFSAVFFGKKQIFLYLCRRIAPET